MTHDKSLMKQYVLESVHDWGADVAAIDNEKLAGVWRECSLHHRQAVVQELDSLPRDAIGDEARRRFAEIYDATIDFSIPPGGRHRT